jgi:hypothetical protein
MADAKEDSFLDFPLKQLQIFASYSITEVRLQCLETIKTCSKGHEYKIDEWLADWLENIISQLQKLEKNASNRMWEELLEWYVLYADAERQRNGKVTLLRAIKFTIDTSNDFVINRGIRLATKTFLARIADPNKGIDRKIVKEATKLLFPFFTKTITAVTEDALRFLRPGEQAMVDWPIVERIGKCIEILGVYDRELYRALGKLLAPYNQGKMSTRGSRSTIATNAETVAQKTFLIDLLALMTRLRRQEQLTKKEAGQEAAAATTEE